MAKYSFEFKKEIVVAYLSGKGGFGSLAKDYGIPNKAQIYRWVKAYQKLVEQSTILIKKYIFQS